MVSIEVHAPPISGSFIIIIMKVDVVKFVLEHSVIIIHMIYIYINTQIHTHT